VTVPSLEASLAALGRCLDRLRVRDAFLALDADGVTLTTVSGATPLATVSYSRRRLARLATVQARRPAPVRRPSELARREDLLRLAGRELARHGGHSAFIVLYDDLLIVDHDGYGAATSVQYRRAEAERAREPAPALSASPAPGCRGRCSEPSRAGRSA
jgi:hypothetical protein